jgi:ATP-dependent DNA ligase
VNPFIERILQARGLLAQPTGVNQIETIMPLPLKFPYPPMEALAVEEIPSGRQWQYEPKWDGFRALVFRDGPRVRIQSKSGQPLERYFPELVQAVLALKALRFVLDSEIVVPVNGRLSFDHLLERIHPAESRVNKLAAEHPAMLIVFDLLVDERGKRLTERVLDDRRKELARFAKRFLLRNRVIRISTVTTDRRKATAWLNAAGANVDGVVAKRRDLAYQSGERSGMQKIKRLRTADCVVGGFRYAAKEKVVGSLLLGLYDDEGRLNHVGFTSSLSHIERKTLTPKLEALVSPPGFTGNAPGGPSRWSTKRSSEWEPLRPKLVVEVQFDHTSGERFRHGAKFIRWRPDKAPRQCTMDQVAKGRQKFERLLTA